MDYYCVSLELVLVVILASLSISAEAQRMKIPLTRGGFELKKDEESIVSHYGVLNVGTPMKTFKVLFDTSTSDCWLPHYEWSPFKTSLHYRIGYLGSDSSTSEKFNSQKSINYRGTILTGKLYTDIIKLGENAAMSGNRQGFMAISEASNEQFKEEPYDGVIGLSPATQSAVGVRNILIGLREANVIGKLEFSFWFNSLLDDPLGGELTLGGVDESKYIGNFYYHRVTDYNNWQLALQRVTLGDLDIGCYGKRCQVVFDTSVTNAYGPSEQVTKIYDAIIPVIDPSSKLPIIDCNRIRTLPNIKFQIDGLVYELLPSNYIRRFKSGTFSTTVKCYIAIKGHLDGNKWILGTNFLSQYYTRFDFDNRQIGFASVRPQHG